MLHDARDAYLESRIFSAEPIELVRMLYQACAGAVRDARRHLASGDIAARSKSISKAGDVVMELAGSLDHERGGDISRRLAQIYDYIQRRLLEANFEQADAPLSEVLGLITTLSEGWEGVRPETGPAARAESPWAQTLAPEPALEAVSSQAWSF